VTFTEQTDRAGEWEWLQMTARDAALPERLDFGGLADWRLLKDELLQLGGGGDEANITALLHLPPYPPAAVVLLEDVQEISDLEAEKHFC
jgi:hypothetical protein